MSRLPFVVAVCVAITASPTSVAAQRRHLPGPTFPPGVLMSNVPIDNDVVRGIKVVLDTAGNAVEKSSRARLIWPDRLAPETSCAEVIDNQNQDDRSTSQRYVATPLRITVGKSQNWATEIGRLDAAVGAEAPPTSGYLRVWERRGTRWVVVAACSQDS